MKGYLRETESLRFDVMGRTKRDVRIGICGSHMVDEAHEHQIVAEISGSEKIVSDEYAVHDAVELAGSR
jgi:hypothetical protein